MAFDFVTTATFTPVAGRALTIERLEASGIAPDGAIYAASVTDPDVGERIDQGLVLWDFGRGGIVAPTYTRTLANWPAFNDLNTAMGPEAVHAHPAGTGWVVTATYLQFNKPTLTATITFDVVSPDAYAWDEVAAVTSSGDFASFPTHDVQYTSLTDLFAINASSFKKTLILLKPGETYGDVATTLNLRGRGTFMMVAGFAGPAPIVKYGLSQTGNDTYLFEKTFGVDFIGDWDPVAESGTAAAATHSAISIQSGTDQGHGPFHVHQCRFLNCGQPIGAQGYTSIIVTDSDARDWRNMGALVGGNFGMAGNRFNCNPDGMGGGRGKSGLYQEHGAARWGGLDGNQICVISKCEAFVNQGWPLNRYHQPAWRINTNQRDNNRITMTENYTEGGSAGISFEQANAGDNSAPDDPSKRKIAVNTRAYVASNVINTMANQISAPINAVQGYLTVLNNFVLSQDVPSENGKLQYRLFDAGAQLTSYDNSSRPEAFDEPIIIMGNTWINESSGNAPVATDSRFATNGMTIIDTGNAIHEPNATTPDDLGPFTTETLATLQYKGRKYSDLNGGVLDASYGQDHLSSALYTPSAGSPLLASATAGTDVPFYDFHGKIRPTGTNAAAAGAIDPNATIPV